MNNTNNTSAANAAIPAQPIATASAVEYPNPSPTAGMTIAQRILHVGGRNPPGSTYVEFGSIQAVEALVRQVLRDQPARDAGQTAPAESPEMLQPGDVRPIVIGGTLCEDGRWWCEALECYVDQEDCDVLPMAPSAYAAPEDAAMQRDAQRYRWLRAQAWNGSSMCVVTRPAESVKLGFDCPSLARLDDAIDAARAAQRGAA